MPYPTRSLELLIFLAGVFPSGLSHSLSYAFGGKPGTESRPKFLLVLALPFPVLLLSVGLFHAEWLRIVFPSVAWIVGGFLCIGLVFGLEYLTAFVWALARTRRMPKGMALQQYWAGSMTWGQHALLVVLAAGEELVFRGFGNTILSQYLGLPVVLTILLTSILYAFNHTFFGPVTILAKFISGLAYGTLYVASGSLIVPIIAHLGFNSALLAAGRALSRSPREPAIARPDSRPR